MSAEESAQKAAGLVPEVYVDLIRRVIPGTVTIVSGIVLYSPIKPKDILSAPTVALGFGFLIFTLVAYVVGLSIDCITGEFTNQLLKGNDFLSIRYVRYLWGSYLDVNGRPAIRGDLSHIIQIEGWQGLLRERVILSNPYARNIIPKVTAEEFLLKNLACSCLIFGILNRLWVSTWFWVVFVLLFWGGFFYRARQTARRTKQFYELLTAPELHGIPAEHS